MIIVVCTIFMWAHPFSPCWWKMEMNDALNRIYIWDFLLCSVPFLFFYLVSCLLFAFFWFSVLHFLLSESEHRMKCWISKVWFVVLYTSSNHCESCRCGLVEKHQYQSCVGICVRSSQNEVAMQFLPIYAYFFRSDSPSVCLSVSSTLAFF